jgi:histidinol-phosphatase (PHP family)
MPWTNYHSHTFYCDGSHAPEYYIKQAIESNLPAYGYSSHAPIDFESDWCIADEKFKRYISDIHSIKNDYSKWIQVYLGLEIDFIPGVAGRHKHLLKNQELDYYIGSIHFIDQFADKTHWNIDTSKELFDKGLKNIFNNNYRAAATRFYELTWQMLQEDSPNVIGHFDKIKMYNNGNLYFNENDSWYKDLIEKTLLEIKNSEVIVEINTRGFYKYGQKELYPSSWIIEKLIEMDLPIMLNSDAHSPDEIVSGFHYAASELKKLGLKKLWILLDNEWKAAAFNENGLML